MSVIDAAHHKHLRSDGKPRPRVFFTRQCAERVNVAINGGVENTQVGLLALVFRSSLFSVLSGKLLRTQDTTVTAAGITVFVSSTHKGVCLWRST